MKRWMLILAAACGWGGPGAMAAAAAESHDLLRSRPGCLFLEIFTSTPAPYVRFLQEVAGFKVRRQEAGFAELRSEAAEIMVNTGQGLPAGHPFHGKIVGHDQGVGVEIGLVVPDPAAARQAALKFPGWSVTGLQRQPWGETDFRVSTPDGYYFRLTEPAR